MNHLKKLCLLLFLSVALTVAPTVKSQAQIEIVLEAIKAAIKAIDLGVQKAQNHIIDLQNIQKQVENTLSQLKLAEIGDWVQKQKDLYSDYFDELKKVKTVITYLKSISDIIDAQRQLISEYKQAFGALKLDSHFSPEEVTYSFNVYSGIVNASVASLDQILTVLESFTFSMTDAARLKIIEKASSEIQEQISDLRRFTSQNMVLSMQRSKSQLEIDFVKSIYGVKN